jgi:hypothetical protein
VPPGGILVIIITSVSIIISVGTIIKRVRPTDYVVSTWQRTSNSGESTPPGGD